MKIKQLTAISIGHLSLDILASSIPILLTFVSGRFDLSVSQIAFGAMLAMFSGALTQPLFGVLADRLQGRWLGAIGLFWMMFFYALVPFAPTYPAMLLFLVVGSLGSGIFHPVGVVNAADAGGEYPTTATSIFFLLGQSGLALGPIISGYVLQYAGLWGLPFVVLAMTPAVLMMALYLRHPISPKQESPTAPKVASETPTQPIETADIVQVSVAIIFALAAITVLRNATMQSYTSLLPKFFQDLGYEPSGYGLMVGFFGFAGALGTFCGGLLGDRFNRRLIIFVSMISSIPFAYLMIGAEGIFYYAMAFMTGLLLSIPHSIVLVMAQAILPKSKGMVGGAVLGLMFASGAAMAWVSGLIADRIGLETVLILLAFLPIGAGLSVFWLPKTRKAEVEA